MLNTYILFTFLDHDLYSEERLMTKNVLYYVYIISLKFIYT
jgi:hypothetical protein